MSDRLLPTTSNVFSNDTMYTEGYDCSLEHVIVVIDTKNKASSTDDDNILHKQQRVVHHTERTMPITSMEVQHNKHDQTDSGLTLHPSNRNLTDNGSRQKTTKGNKSEKVPPKGSSMVKIKTPKYKHKNLIQNKMGRAVNDKRLNNKMKELRSLLPDHLSSTSKTDSSVLKNIVEYIQMLKQEQDDCKRLEEKLKNCDLKVLQITKRIERLQNSLTIPNQKPLERTES